MLDRVIGRKTNPLAVAELLRALDGVTLTGTLYLGYPILASAEEPVTIDALLTCTEAGLVVLDFQGFAVDPAQHARIAERQDDLYTALMQKLLAFKPLRDGRRLAVELRVMTFAPTGPSVEPPVATPGTLRNALAECAPISDELLRALDAAIQRVTNIKPANKRLSVRRPDSRGAIMKEIEKEIANLDRWQKRAAIESPEGPQRIRGLAGSGKTIVLALKAAYLHAQDPHSIIGVTFNTRSLYQQFRDLIRRFCFEHMNDEPNWDTLRVQHAWGSARQPGIYSEIASASGLSAQDFTYGKFRFGAAAAFGGVCRELLDALAAKEPAPIYDAILIDEAQDLPQPFFELALLAAKPPKRIIWAYDELQNLGAYRMAPPAELFGSGPDGNPRVPELRTPPDGPSADIVLPVCYRNTPWALTVAHALGFGIYRDGGLVQFFDDPALWHSIGYQVIAGDLAAGQHVTLCRRPDASPDFFSRLLDPTDAMRCKVFKDQKEQAQWVAENIKRNITIDELDIRDILIIMADPVSAGTEAAVVMDALQRQDIPAHLAGVTSSRDELFADRSIAISGIFRAKGNEAPMVYVLNSHYGLGGPQLIKRRNTLFTAITRSRGWVRLCGCGTAMEAVQEEVSQVTTGDYRLAFRVATPEELAHMRRIHRDLAPGEQARARKVEASLSEVVDIMEQDDLPFENLPEPLRRRLEKALQPRNRNDT